MTTTMLYISDSIKTDPYVGLLDDFYIIYKELDEINSVFYIDLLILHIQDIDERFLKIINSFKERNSDLKVIVVTDLKESNFLIELINIGIDKYISKNNNNFNIIEAVKCVACDILQYEHMKYTKEYNKTVLELVYETFLFLKLDLDGTILDINDLFCSLIKIDRDRLIGQNYRVVCDEKFWKFLENDVYDRLIKGDLYRGALKLKSISNDIVIDCSIYTIDNNISQSKDIICIAQDISESHKLFMQSLSNLLDNEESLTILFDTNYKPVMVNKKYLDIAGSPSQEQFFNTCTLWDWSTYNQHLSNIEYSADRGSMLSSFMKNSKCNKNNGSIIAVDIYGNKHYYTTHISTIANPILPSQWYYILYFIDITSQEVVKNQAIESAKLMTMGQLSAAITHEINTPLTYIKGNLELLQLECDSDGLKEQFDEIFDGIFRISSIVESMYEFSGNCKKDLQVCNINDTIYNSVKLIQNRAKYISKIYINSALYNSDKIVFDSPCLIECKPEKLEQVWIIILNNALDELEKGNLEYNDRRIFINCYSDIDNIHITIRDNGGGIGLNEPKDIFKFGVSGSKKKSMGVGLNVAEMIIKAHGGEIDAYNDKDGAVFEIKLKLFKERAGVV